jgi:hypothetical protein
MKKAFALALMMSAAVFGTAEAREMRAAARPSGDIDIIYMNSNADMGMPVTRITPTKTTASEAKAEIARDPALRRALVRHDVELKNVMAIGKEDDGGIAVYVR